MIFFNRNKKITIDAFTAHPEVAEHFPLERSVKHYPQWWKNLPKEYEAKNFHDLSVPFPTAKTCVGIINHFQNSFTLPMWSDVLIETDEHGAYKYEFSAGNALGMQQHPAEQYSNHWDNYIHAKLLAPWVIKEKTGINFSFIPATWNLSDHLRNMHIVPGTVDFKYQYACHVNMFLNKEKNRNVIEAGTPLYNIVPLTEKEWDIKIHVVSQDEYTRMLNITGAPISFRMKYYKNKKRMEEKERVSKCPFGFGKNK